MRCELRVASSRRRYARLCSELQDSSPVPRGDALARPTQQQLCDRAVQDSGRAVQERGKPADHEALGGLCQRLKWHQLIECAFLGCKCDEVPGVLGLRWRDRAGLDDGGQFRCRLDDDRCADPEPVVQGAAMAAACRLVDLPALVNSALPLLRTVLTLV
jgi:hypothetical protein